MRMPSPQADEEIWLLCAPACCIPEMRTQLVRAHAYTHIHSHTLSVHLSPAHPWQIWQCSCTVLWTLYRSASLAWSPPPLASSSPLPLHSPPSASASVCTNIAASWLSACDGANSSNSTSSQPTLNPLHLTALCIGLRFCCARRLRSWRSGDRSRNLPKHACNRAAATQRTSKCLISRTICSD